MGFKPSSPVDLSPGGLSQELAGMLDGHEPSLIQALLTNHLQELEKKLDENG